MFVYQRKCDGLRGSLNIAWTMYIVHVLLVTAAGVVQVIDNMDLFCWMEIVKAAQPETVLHIHVAGRVKISWPRLLLPSAPTLMQSSTHLFQTQQELSKNS